MTTATTLEVALEAAKAKTMKLIANLDVEGMKELAIAANDEMRLPVDFLDWILEHLETMMPEDEFCAFCETL